MTACREPVESLSTHRDREGTEHGPEHRPEQKQKQKKNLNLDQSQKFAIGTSVAWLGKEEPRTDVGALPFDGLAGGNDLYEAFSCLAELLLLRPYSVAEREIDGDTAALAQHFVGAGKGSLGGSHALTSPREFEVKDFNHLPVSLGSAAPSRKQPSRRPSVPATQCPPASIILTALSFAVVLALTLGAAS